MQANQTYIFTKLPTVKFFPLLIPAVFLALAALANAPAGAYVAGVALGLVLIAFGLIPKITVSNGKLTQRNSLGITSRPVSLVQLKSIHARRSYVKSIWSISGVVLNLVDEAGNSTSFSVAGWKNRAQLEKIIASSPTGSDVDVNELAVNLLKLR